MFRGWNTADLDLMKINNKHLVQPCIWFYGGNKQVFDQVTSNQYIGSTLVNFQNIWVASAYKGAYSITNTFIDHELHLTNTMNWIDFTQKCHFKEKIKGIILTGWSRFTHETTLCELLCMSVPSLSLCLSVIEN